MSITPTWRAAIDAFTDAQTAAGHSATTRYTRRQHLQHLARRTRLSPWRLTPDDLARYAAAQPWKRETRRGRRVTFLAFWAWALNTGRTTTNPTAALERIKPSDPDPRPIPDPVYLAALLRADHDEAIWIDLAAEHGLRRAEIAAIDAADLIDTLHGTELRVHGKGDKTRSIPLTAAMTRALRDLAGDRDEGPLWPGADHGHISPRWLGKRINRLLDGRWTIHKLRHRAATRFWEASGGDAYAVARLMGWANLNMVHRYVQQPTRRLREIVNAASRTGHPLDSGRPSDR